MDTKQLILETAGKLFQKYGYEATSIQQIIDACGLSKGGFYHHFSSKESVFQSLSQMKFQPLYDAILTILEAETGGMEEKIQRILEAKTDFYLHQFELIHPIFSDEKHMVLQFKGKQVVKRMLHPLLEKLLEQLEIQKLAKREETILIFGLHEMIFEYIMPDVRTPQELAVYFATLDQLAQKYFS